MTVAIIGAGPAGLLAAYGCSRAGIKLDEITIFDPKPGHANIFSLQYLHEPCDLPGKWVRKLDLHYQGTGQAFADPDFFEEDEYERLIKCAYNEKLGRPLNEDNSTKFLWNTPVEVWSLKDAYKYLWGLFQANLPTDGDATVEWDDLTPGSTLVTQHDLVISTAPLNKLRPELTWPTRQHWIAMDYSPVKDHSNDTCVYNVDPQTPWTRATRLDGGVATEYVSEQDPTIGPLTTPFYKVAAGAPDITKDLAENVVLAGRWGTWDPSQLTHHAFKIAQEAVYRGTPVR